MKEKNYTLQATLWLYPGETASWHFITLPKKAGVAIKETYKSVARGWGSLPVEVCVGDTTWNTSIFPDKVSGSYLLPIKANVRKKEELEEGDTISFTLTVCP